ncbi:MAG: hypothetical protein WKF84_10105 [Pyrinomonadaceae bacterium]
MRIDLPREIVVEDINPAVVVEIFGVAAHRGNGCALIVEGDAVEQAAFFESSVLIY